MPSRAETRPARGLARIVELLAELGEWELRRRELAGGVAAARASTEPGELAGADAGTDAPGESDRAGDAPPVKAGRNGNGSVSHGT